MFALIGKNTLQKQPSWNRFILFTVPVISALHGMEDRVEENCSHSQRPVRKNKVKTTGLFPTSKPYPWWTFWFSYSPFPKFLQPSKIVPLAVIYTFNTLTYEVISDSNGNILLPRSNNKMYPKPCINFYILIFQIFI